jgi:membrane-associated protease RseP (regulator of RpoE activity)
LREKNQKYSVSLMAGVVIKIGFGQQPVKLREISSCTPFRVVPRLQILFGFVKIGKRPLTMAAASENHKKEENDGYGFQVTDLTPETARRFNIKETAGVIVVGVAPNSKAQAAGIRQGDLIIEINRQEVASVKDFKNLVDQHKKGDGINFLVKRMNA